MSLDPQGSVFNGALWGGLAFAFEHPLEVLKIKCQYRPSRIPSELPKALFEQKGFSGFYSGGVVSLGARIIRGMYRWPSINAMQDCLESALPTFSGSKEWLKNISTATTISLAEVFAVLPSQKLLVTKINSSSYRHFIHSEFKYDGVASLYRGSLPTFMNYWAGWASFMESSRAADKISGRLDPESKHPQLMHLAKSILVGSAMTCLIPLEFIQLHVQTDPKLEKLSPPQIISNLYQKYGAKGFISGARFAFVHKCLQNFLGSLFFQYMHD